MRAFMAREGNHIFPFRESDLVEFLHIRRGKYGLLLILITLATTITTCTLFMMYSPLFSEL